MTTKLKKWGNSAGVRFTKDITNALGVAPEDELSFEIKDDKVTFFRKRYGKARDTWRHYFKPSKKTKVENISENIDEIIYG